VLPALRAQFVNISITERNLTPSEKTIYISFGRKFAVYTKLSNLRTFLVEGN
jgi:hypothetical protein